MRKPQWVDRTSVLQKNRVPSTRAWAAPLLIFATLIASPATADPKAKAAAHYKQGKAFFDAKQYAQAITQYRAAYEIDKLPAHLFNIARAYHLSGDLNAAIEHYQKFLDADPQSANATVARKEIVEATKQRDELEAKRKTDEDAKRKQVDLEKKRAIIETHIKQAKAYEQAGAWANAGEEYTFAGEHDPEQLLAAAQAFRTVPDLVKARFAMITYLDRVPSGPRSDEVRKDLATITREIEVAALSKPGTDRPVDKAEPVPEAPFHAGWSRFAGRAAFAVTQGTTNPLKGNSDGLVAGPGYDVGVAARFDVGRRFALQPELAFARRTFSFDSDQMQNAVELFRTGGMATGLALFALTRGTVRAHILAGGDFAAMVHNTGNLLDPGTNTIQLSKIEFAVQGGLLVDFGKKVSLDLRYRRTVTNVSDDFPTKLASFSLGLSVGFARR